MSFTRHSKKDLRVCFLLICFLLVTNLKLIAQKNNSKFFTEIKVGASLPVSKFSDKTFTNSPWDNNPSGLAKTGLNINLSLGYHLNKSTGILILLGNTFNKQDAASYKNYLTQINGNGRNEVSTNSWKIFKVMAGGFYEIPFSTSSKLKFQSKITAGICKTAIPGYSYTLYDQNGMLQGAFTQAKTSLPSAFCYQLSAGINYQINSRIDLLFDVSYCNSNPQINYSYNPNFPDPGPSISGKRKYNLSSVNVMAGIGIKL
ncbi:MAG TPA: hypothetical protein VGP55_14535 [Chitinophagaceae bacterium]|nr:hypothetical protein [Chitinophagaceae bacterium]